MLMYVKMTEDLIKDSDERVAVIDEKDHETNFTVFICNVWKVTLLSHVIKTTLENLGCFKSILMYRDN